ncbi:MAG: hypothetical protein J0H91_22155 [Rhodospirillales bacterium]|nr:hypothetical protein [Rhodospirillales bacterium]
MEWLLEIVLVGLLAATLFHALRLERALGVLKRDRAALEALVAQFNASTQAAEQGVERLHEAADGAGRQIARHVDSATRLKDDLLFLNDRGEKLADRLDRLVRAGRALDQPAPRLSPEPPEPYLPTPFQRPEPAPEPPVAAEPAALEEVAPRVRSQAERDLLKALRLAR